MTQSFKRIFGSLLFAVVLFGALGCDAIEDVFEREKEVKGNIEEIGADYLVLDAIRYAVTDRTSFDGIGGLSELSVGEEVEVEYEETAGSRTALEIERAGSDD
jgi:hypothetical protein